MSKHVISKEEIDKLSGGMKRIFRLGSDREFAGRIALKIVEMVERTESPRLR